jgi:hypothetical protein
MPGVLRCVLESLAERGSPLRVIAALSRYVAEVAMSDYHSFRADGVPYLFLTCGIDPARYHQLADTPDWLDYDKMATIHEMLCELVVQLEHRPIRVATPIRSDGRPSRVARRSRHGRRSLVVAGDRHAAGRLGTAASAVRRPRSAPRSVTQLAAGI